MDIAAPLLTNAKKAAAQRGVTLSVVFEDALRVMLAARPAAGGKKFRLIRAGGGASGGLVNPDIDLNRTSQLLVDEDAEQYAKSHR